MNITQTLQKNTSNNHPNTVVCFANLFSEILEEFWNTEHTEACLQKLRTQRPNYLVYVLKCTILTNKYQMIFHMQFRITAHLELISTRKSANRPILQY